MLSCSIWFSASSFWMGGGLESRCVGRVYGADNFILYRISFYRILIYDKIKYTVCAFVALLRNKYILECTDTERIE